MTDSGAIKAVLFDIDGTLVDSNYLHVDAWSRAFAEVGHPVDTWRIHRCIGMDSAKLLDTLLGDDAERLGEQAKEQHGRYYQETAPRLRAFDRAQDLLRELSGRGLRVVLATSAPPEEFEVLQRVLDVDDAVSAVTTAADVGTAKPAPDVVQVALDKAGIEPGEAVMVGDATWDAEAAGRAGVRSIGVLTGGMDRAVLLDAGAEVVYDDVAELLAHLAESPVLKS